MAATAANTNDVEFEVESGLRWYHSTPSVQYGFCQFCGSSLFWKADDKPDHLSITAGSLDTPTGLTTTIALFGSEASDYHRLDPEIETVPLDRKLTTGVNIPGRQNEAPNNTSNSRSPQADREN